MDPNATLDVLRELVRQAWESDLQGEPTDRIRDEMAEYFDALDAWLTGGGFLPAEWIQERTR